MSEPKDTESGDEAQADSSSEAAQASEAGEGSLPKKMKKKVSEASEPDNIRDRNARVRAEAADKRELMADAFEAVAGERLRPTYVLLDGEDAEPQEAPAEEVDHDALVERLKSEFDAEEVG